MRQAVFARRKKIMLMVKYRLRKTGDCDIVVLGGNMVALIHEKDKNFMANASFIKNAVLYKDIFAFYDAFTFIMSQEKEMLPNYCFLNNGDYCLEGICLLIKDYSSELGFESVKLSIDYLKVIYYTIASYSKDGNLPDKKVIEAEYNGYKKASEEVSKTTKAEYNDMDDKFSDAKSSYDKLNDIYGKKLVSSRLLNTLSIVFLVAGILFAGASFSLSMAGIITPAIAYTLVAVFAVVGVSLFFALKWVSKRQDSDAGELAYTMQGKKKSKDELESDRQIYLEQYNKIIGERYEYTSNFGDLLNSFRKKLSYEEILRKAREYKILSYNVRVDVLTIAENQEKDITGITSSISAVSGENSKTALGEIYKKILKKDWLYYSNEVRLEFLKKFVDVSEATFDWKLEINDEIIRPFGIDIKSISKEKISYLKNRNGLFVATSLDKLTGTKYFKNLKELNMVDANNLSKIQNIKMEFYSHFFDYDKTKNYNNLFYSDKIEDNVKISDEILNTTAKIPTYVLLQLKLIENKLKVGNSDNSVIKQISNFINKHDGTIDDIVIEEKKMEEEDKQAEVVSVSVEEINDYSLKYSVGNETFTGYKLSSL